MNEYLLIKFLHIVGFAYWLGGDLGVFHSSYYVADPNRATEVRVAAAKILFWLDQVPRICMTMMLPLGVHLAWLSGLLGFGALVMTAIWLLAFGWLAMVVWLHVSQPSSGKTFVTRFDFWFRLVLSVGLIAAGGAALALGQPQLPYWVAWKLTLFGGLIGCGLLVRLQLREFGPAFARMAAGNPSDADNTTIQKSLGGTRPYVVGIWIGLLASTALGLHLV